MSGITSSSVMKYSGIITLTAYVVLFSACSKDSSFISGDIGPDCDGTGSFESEIVFSSAVPVDLSTKAVPASNAISVKYEPVDNLPSKASPVAGLDCFFLSVTKGTNHSVVKENSPFEYSIRKDGYVSSDTPLYWPPSDENYHFYASNSEIGPDGDVSCHGDSDIVYATLENPIYRSDNSLYFNHIYARIGTVSVSAPAEFDIKFVSATISCPTGGTFNLRSGKWESLDSPSALNLSSSNDKWVVSGSYVIDIVYDITLQDTEYPNQNISGKINLEAGCLNNISAQIIGPEETAVYATPVITVTYPDVSAGGASAYPIITYTQTMSVSLADGTQVSRDISGTISNSSVSGDRIVSADGTSVGSGEAAINQFPGLASTASVTGQSLGTVERTRTKIFEASITCVINGVAGTGKADVYQQGNRIENTTYGSPYDGPKSYGEPYWTDKSYYGDYTYGAKIYGDPIYGSKENDGAEYGSAKSYGPEYPDDRQYGEEYAGTYDYGSDYQDTYWTGTPEYGDKNYGSEYDGEKSFGTDYQGTYQITGITYGSKQYGSPYQYGSRRYGADYEGRYEEGTPSYGPKSFGTEYSGARSYGSDYEGSFQEGTPSYGPKNYGGITYGNYEYGPDYEDGTSGTDVSYGPWTEGSKVYGTATYHNSGYTAVISAYPASFPSEGGSGTYTASGSHIRTTTTPWTRTDTRSEITAWTQYYSRTWSRSRTQPWTRTKNTPYTQYWSRNWTCDIFKDWSRTKYTPYTQYWNRDWEQDYYRDYSRTALTDYRQYYSRDWTLPHYKNWTRTVTTPFKQYYSRTWSLPYYRNWTQNYYIPWTQDFFQKWTRTVTTPWTRDRYQEWTREQFKVYYCDVLRDRTDTYTSTATAITTEKTGTDSGTVKINSESGTDKVGTDSGTDTGTDSGTDLIRTDSGAELCDTKSGTETSRTETGTDKDYRYDSGNLTSSDNGTDQTGTTSGTDSDYRYSDGSSSSTDTGSEFYYTDDGTEENYRSTTGTSSSTDSGTDHIRTDSGTDTDYRSTSGSTSSTEYGSDIMSDETGIDSKYRSQTLSLEGTDSKEVYGSDTSDSTVSDTPSVSASASWISISSGAFTVSQNSTSSTRSCSITASNGTAADSETISQTGYTKTIKSAVIYLDGSTNYYIEGTGSKTLSGIITYSDNSTVTSGFTFSTTGSGAAALSGTTLTGVSSTWGNDQSHHYADTEGRKVLVTMSFQGDEAASAYITILPKLISLSAGMNGSLYVNNTQTFYARLTVRNYYNGAPCPEGSKSVSSEAGCTVYRGDLMSFQGKGTATLRGLKAGTGNVGIYWDDPFGRRESAPQISVTVQ